MFSLFQARKMVDIPYWKSEMACFHGIFPHFLTSPPVAKVGISHLIIKFTAYDTATT